jgi:hypothetical protein
MVFMDYLACGSPLPVLVITFLKVVLGKQIARPSKAVT